MLKVILADDEFLVRLAFSSTINWKEHGFEFIGAASNGVEAYEMIEKHHPDIVITDLTMPQMGGLELIEKVKAAKLPCEFVVLSCHNEFEFVKQALKLGVFDYILKLSMDMNELMEILERLKQKIQTEKAKITGKVTYLKQQYLDPQHLDPQFLDPQFLDQQYQDPQFQNPQYLDPRYLEQQNLEEEEFQVVVVNSGEIDAEDREKTNSQISGFLTQMTGSLIHKSVFIYKGFSILLLWEETEELFEILKGIQTEIKKYLDITVEMGIGKKVKGNVHIKESFETALMAYRHRFYQGEGSICVYESLNYQNEKNMSFSLIFPDVKELLKLGMQKEVRDHVVRYLQNACSKADIEPEKMRMYLHELLTRIKLRVEEQKPGIITGAMYSEIYQQVNNLGYLEDIESGLVYFSDQILEKLNLEEENEIVRNAKKYIHAHLNEELKVMEVSRQLGVNADYLSHLFRTETGIRFIDYVNHTRIEYACDRIRFSNDKIYEIGEQCGFENANYFIKVFKKNMGQTPLEYKKSHENMKI